MPKKETMNYNSEDYASLAPGLAVVLDRYIMQRLAPGKKTGPYTSKGLTLFFTKWARVSYPGANTDFYVTNDAFKGAMLAADYEPVNAKALNWNFHCTYSKTDRFTGYFELPADLLKEE